MRRSTIIALTVLLATCAGCGSLSTGASMRVDVDVYKGPLSKPLYAQWNEFVGIVDGFGSNLARLDLSLTALETTQGCDSPASRAKNANDCATIRKLGDELQNIYLEYLNILLPINYLDTGKDYAIREELLASLSEECKVIPTDPRSRSAAIENFLQKHRSATGRIHRVDDINKFIAKESGTSNRSRVREILGLADHFAALLKSKSMYYAETQISYPSQNRDVRAAYAVFSNFTAEYSNQIGSRADVLGKQLFNDEFYFDEKEDINAHGIPRERMPLSDHLRDASPTDFLNLYSWNDAAMPRSWRAGFTREDVNDRIRGAERLFDDHYWSNINSVYASGQGEFRMALIKDDVGNWNLKSFDNDPTELVTTTSDLSQALLAKAVATVASGGLGSGTLDKVKEAIQTSAEAQTSKAGLATPSVNVDEARRILRTQLNDLRAEAAEKEAAWAQVGNQETITTEKAAYREKFRNRLQDLLKSHDYVLNVLEASAARPTAATSTTSAFGSP